MKERRRGRRTDNKRRDAVSQGRHKRRRNVDEGEMRIEKGETSAEKRQKIPRHIGAVDQTTNNKRRTTNDRGEVSAAYRCCGPNDKRQGAIKQ